MFTDFGFIPNTGSLKLVCCCLQVEKWLRWVGGGLGEGQSVMVAGGPLWRYTSLSLQFNDMPSQCTSAISCLINYLTYFNKRLLLLLEIGWWWPPTVQYHELRPADSTSNVLLAKHHQWTPYGDRQTWTCWKASHQPLRRSRLFPIIIIIIIRHDYYYYECFKSYYQRQIREWITR
jgi:hypothetical protein